LSTWGAPDASSNPGWAFPCATYPASTCDSATQYCLIFQGPGGGACQPIPAGCTADVTCTCLADPPFSCTDQDGGITVVDPPTTK
jgi:hypothetical protein